MTMATLVAILTKMLATLRQQVQSPQHNWHVHFCNFCALSQSPEC